jgi:hypothetical protein
MRDAWAAEQFLLERVYGTAAAWERRMDRAVLAQVARLPGVPSSHVGLDHVLGLDARVGFEDVLNRECGWAWGSSGEGVGIGWGLGGEAMYCSGDYKVCAQPLSAAVCYAKGRQRAASV